MNLILGIVSGLVLAMMCFGGGFNFGYQYAEEIATGRRKVKPSKDFMKGLRKGDQ